MDLTKLHYPNFHPPFIIQLSLLHPVSTFPAKTPSPLKRTLPAAPWLENFRKTSNSIFRNFPIFQESHGLGHRCHRHPFARRRPENSLTVHEGGEVGLGAVLCWKICSVLVFPTPSLSNHDPFLLLLTPNR